MIDVSVKTLPNPVAEQMEAAAILDNWRASERYHQQLDWHAEMVATMHRYRQTRDLPMTWHDYAQTELMRVDAIIDHRYRHTRRMMRALTTTGRNMTATETRVYLRAINTIADARARAKAVRRAELDAGRECTALVVVEKTA